MEIVEEDICRRSLEEAETAALKLRVIGKAMSDLSLNDRHKEKSNGTLGARESISEEQWRMSSKETK